MCGIAGIVKPGPDPEQLLARMISAMRHRGPDETGIYVDDRVAMGHARLSIIGLEDGTQPISNEDGTLWIVFNGEIFNYPELKTDLESKGHIIRTGTDTEILVHIYEEYGTECLRHLNGQFAFAIWDSNRQELFLARDRVGIRPLHYCQAGDRFIFASEIKALFLDPAVPRQIDAHALSQVFTLWTTLTPKTVFKHVCELPPGHFMLLDKSGSVRLEPFWSIPYFSPESREPASLDQAVEELRELLLDAIRIRLRADVPVGAYLSGGLDSSIITSLISGNFNNNLRTFSIGFKEKAFDETPYQQMMVEHLGTDHSRLLIDNGDIRDNFPAVVRHCEKPILRTAPVPMFLLSRLVRENSFKVVLTGEGADEVFAGYNIFKEAKVRQFWSRNPGSGFRPLLLERLYPYIFKNPARGRTYLRKFFAVSDESAHDPLFSHRIRWGNTGKNSTFFSSRVKEELGSYQPETDVLASLPMDFSDRDLLSRAQTLEMDIFLSNYLLSSQGDRVAMGNSLELRLPFLDFRVIEFAMKLPSHWKLKVLKEKFILKEAFSGLIPESIVSRPKHPYRAPIRDVFFGSGNGYAHEYLSEANLEKTGYFDPKKTGHLVNRFINDDRFVESETQNMALIGILSTQILHDQYIENFNAGSIQPIAVDKIIDRRKSRT
ncbi:MAG: asparagine synthase (glutamine-hydrolyzing) [Geobacteraceae bacterium]|nr:asparagine synthase (glutamine-hydrolyzing) [Geobacteraceae bacterium]